MGLGNHKFFLLFLLYIFMSSFYSLVLVVSRYMYCLPSDVASGDLNHIDTGVSKQSASNTCVDIGAGGAVLVVLLIIEAILFGLFTMCMACDQAQGIMSSQTAIDRLKGAAGEKKSIMLNMR